MGRLAIGLSFIALPILEMALLVKTGQVIGFWATLAMLVGAGVIGAMILSRQSLTALRRAQEAAAQGQPPVGPMLDSMFLFLAGVLLITPGLITDALALLLLVPPIRRGVARWSVRHLFSRANVHVRGFRVDGERGPKAPDADPGRADGPIIEGEFERLGETTAEPRRVKDRDQM
jgi:UPF0716 protein FxsA